ncbi:MAG: hypothetical protein AB8B85_16565 [Paracoccaceae bacterium]
MSFIAPLALLLLLPLALIWVLAGRTRMSSATRLPGAWGHVVSASLKSHTARRSGLGRTGVPALCLVLGGLLVLSLARPGLETEYSGEYANLAGRVVVLDVDARLAEHRLFLDELHGAGPVAATAVVAVSGDAYRIVPFTTDKGQIDRYVRVLNAGMMPVRGHRPHLGVAMAERLLEKAGFAARQIVLISAKLPPERLVALPRTGTSREIVVLGDMDSWKALADAWGAGLGGRGDSARIARDLQDTARTAANAELPDSRLDLTTWMLALATAIWLFLFRRRAS